MTAPSDLRLGFHLAPGMRVGLYGGSFDPAHQGHALVAAVALRRLALDRVIWLVSPSAPLKAGATLSMRHRMASAARQVRGPKMLVSDVEGRLATRYTVDTVRGLKRRFPAVRFVWIMGADGLAQFHLWRDWLALATMVPIAVIARPGYVFAALNGPAARRLRRFRLAPSAAARLALTPPPAWLYLTAPLNPISSTKLRDGA